ncbi:MAG: DUF6439 family protein [Cyanobacteriota bacterium]|nr:DUF6439 family protein [Cyanobacteriota bacterium]
MSDRQQDWPSDAMATAVLLQRQLSIGERDWHRYKGQRSRRAAEQLAAALVQLLSGDSPAQAQPTEARLRALELLEHAELWLRGEVSDPGCGSHRRPAGSSTD